MSKLVFFTEKRFVKARKYIFAVHENQFLTYFYEKSFGFCQFFITFLVRSWKSVVRRKQQGRAKSVVK